MAPAVSASTRIPSGSAIPASAGLPGIPQSQQPRRFVVEVFYGRDKTSTIAEAPLADTVLDRVVADIVSGQHSHVMRVFELRDCTREVLAAVAAKAEEDGNPVHDDLANFLRLYGFHASRAAPDPEWEWTPAHEREPA